MMHTWWLVFSLQGPHSDLDARYMVLFDVWICKRSVVKVLLKLLVFKNMFCVFFVCNNSEYVTYIIHNKYFLVSTFRWKSVRMKFFSVDYLSNPLIATHSWYKATKWWGERGHKCDTKPLPACGTLELQEKYSMSLPMKPEQGLPQQQTTTDSSHIQEFRIHII